LMTNLARRDHLHPIPYPPTFEMDRGKSMKRKIQMMLKVNWKSTSMLQTA
jgi:hypothetical protein